VTPEARLLANVIKKFRELRAAGVPIKWIKIHGNQYMEAGSPDVIGVIDGHAFAVELKIGKNEPTALQLRRIEEWRAAGATVGVARSVDEVLRILGLG